MRRQVPNPNPNPNPSPNPNPGPNPSPSPNRSLASIVRRQVRPFGANALLASYTEDGPQLYSIDTSGVSARFFATAMGKARHVGEI